MVAEPQPSHNVHPLSSHFPLTWPVPSPLTNPNLLTPKDIHREEDLFRNPSSFRQWWTSIVNARDHAIQSTKSAAPPEAVEDALLGPLATDEARLALQQLTYLYETALYYFPGSFKLWKSYLQMRCSYVLGKGIKRKRAGGRKKWADMKEAMEDEELEEETFEDGLDPLVGWAEWKSLVAVFERALMWLPTMPRIWLMYFNVLSHPLCPAPILHTHARRTFDRALRSLPPSLHARIWPRYLLWAEQRGGMTTVVIYRRYLKIDPSLTERYVGLLLSTKNGAPRPLEAAKLLLSLARRAAKGEYTSTEGKSPYQLLGDWLEVVEKYPEEVGLDVEEADAQRKSFEAQMDATEVQNEATITSDKLKASINEEKKLSMEEDEVDPASNKQLDIEGIVKRDGLAIYKDQAGRLWSGLATYYIKRGEFDRSKATFEEGLATVLTVRDFTQIFDAYAEFSETIIQEYMEALADEEDEEATREMDQEVDVRIKDFERLMDRRPFLVNDVLLRRNPNDVQEWEKRIVLWADDDEKVADTYAKAIAAINPKKATPNFHNIYVNYAKFYENGGVTGSAKGDLQSARRILEKAIKVPFRTVDELAEMWCEWAEMELRNEKYDEAIRVMHRATALPKNTRMSYHDQSLPVQARLFKSLKLWSFYVDLEESIGTVETTKKAYDQILELRIANAQVIINYAAFLEDNQYFEESFKVYERGVELFTYPVAFEIWNIYLSKFVRRYRGSKLERARDLFEQALEKCPEKSCKPIFLMYGRLEEDYGLARRAMNIYERATQVVEDKDKFEMYTIYIAKATENYGLPATRPIYERALEVLPNKQTVQMCLRFASLERKLGEIDRARAIYAYASQFCDPRVEARFWTEWNSFEIETGSEDTFREMLRIKRSIQAKFNTAASYLVAQAEASRQQGGKTNGTSDAAPSAGRAADPMAAAERDAERSKGPAFVSSAQHSRPGDGEETNGTVEKAPATGNEDEIQIDDDEF